MLLQDIREGYGPERYENREGPQGKYRVQIKYFGHSANTFGNETHAQVTIVLDAGTPTQKIIERSLVLRRKGHVQHVAWFTLGDTAQIAR